MTDSNNWYIEHFERTGSAIGYRITGKLDEVQSPFRRSKSSRPPTGAT